MHVDLAGLNVANGHQTDAFDVEMLVNREHERGVGVGFQHALDIVHEGVHSLTEVDAVVLLEGPRFEPGLFEQHLDLVFVDPTAIGRVDHGQASLDASTGEGDQDFAQRGVHGGHFDDARVRGRQGVEERRESFGVLGGTNERENACAVRAGLFVDIGMDVSLVGRFCDASSQFIRGDHGDVEHDHGAPRWQRLKNQWVVRLLAWLSVPACCREWPWPSPTRLAPHQIQG